MYKRQGITLKDRSTPSLIASSIMERVSSAMLTAILPVGDGLVSHPAARWAISVRAPVLLAISIASLRPSARPGSPVSYTHLDVYKRQRLYKILAMVRVSSPLTSFSSRSRIARASASRFLSD